MTDGDNVARLKPVGRGIARRHAVWFVVLLGTVSLFADMTYEGARAITGPYLAALGASATIVGIVAGAGELVGYGVRLASGFLIDRTHRYWAITFLGYVVNLGAVPLLALAGNWPVAVLLIIAERTGKAIRVPARDAMLSHATQATGRGWGFGLHEAMDQAGATIGPLIVTAVLAADEGYREGFAVLLIPAILSIAVLAAARFLYPQPRYLELEEVEFDADRLPQVYWLYLAALALIAAGYADFPLIAFHFQATGSVSPVWIPVFYSIAMASHAIAALCLGRMFDRVGAAILLPAVALSASFAIWVFLGGFYLSLVGMILWGIGMGAQETVLRAFVAEIVAPDRRGSAYGILNAIYGVAWFAGSALMGVLYDLSIPALIAFSMACEIVAVLALAWIGKRFGRASKGGSRRAS